MFKTNLALETIKYILPNNYIGASSDVKPEINSLNLANIFGQIIKPKNFILYFIFLLKFSDFT